MDEVERREAHTIGRRRFLSWFNVALGGLGAVIVGVPFFGLWLEPVLKGHGYPTAWRAVGKVGDFQIGRTVEVTFLNASSQSWTGVSARTGAYLRRTGTNDFTAFSIYCQHLGCPVQWRQDAQLFLCPCHGGVYYANGEVAGGPPLQALRQYPVQVRNGQVEIKATGIPYTY